ncbi:MAG TPA: transcriptional regulator [Selenomonas sp.]|nr:transcriptional regulator [Selenomonas sp.]
MESVIALVIAIAIICVVAKLIALPFKILWKLISNSVIGALMLWVLTLFGAPVQINFFSALIAGIFGLPGVATVFLYYL